MLRLVAIVGPTATGKTWLGVEVAHRLGSEIVSADSRQVYRGLDLGTGKDLHEYSRVSPPVPYHLIDVAEPEEVYTLFRYQQECYAVLADRAEAEPFAGGTTPLLMVGGTGLYVEAVLRGYRIADVPEDPELRRRLAARPRAELVRELAETSPELHTRTDLSSTRRVVRALEVAAAERRGPVRYSPPTPVELDARVFALELPRSELHDRIELRLHQRLGEGMVGEVQRLLDRGVPPSRLDALGTEYREIAAYLLGRKPYPRMVDDLERSIRRLAKRQETYFRGLPRRGVPVTWIAPTDVDAVLAACR